MNQEVETGKDLDILHLDSHVLYKPVLEHLMLMVETEDFFINNPTRAS